MKVTQNENFGFSCKRYKNITKRPKTLHYSETRDGELKSTCVAEQGGKQNL